MQMDDADDLRNSLATALARLEAYRNRERVLQRLNQQLRNKLRDVGLEEVEECSPLPPVPDSVQQQQAPAVDTLQPTTSTSSPFLPVYFHTAEGKVPGGVLAMPTSLEFVQVKARITPAEYLGVRTVRNVLLQPLAPVQQVPEDSAGQALAAARVQAGGVLLGTASWLLERVRRSSSTGGAEENSASNNATYPPSYEGVTGAAPDNFNAGIHDQDPDNAADFPIEEDMQVWEVVWKGRGQDGRLQRLTFEATPATRAFLHRQVEAWSMSVAEDCSEMMRMSEPGDAYSNADGLEAATSQTVSPSKEHTQGVGLGMTVAEPQHLQPGRFMPQLDQKSTIVTMKEIMALASAVPARHQLSNWTLLYSMAQHGISLQTLYRRAAGAAPTILIVRDTMGYIFGSYTSDSWRIAPRYYGTGETFVFQLQPHLVAWSWRQRSTVRNDYFMFAAPHSIAVGGGGHFAIWLDGDLVHGNSGISETFGSPCLASAQDFLIGKVELWGLS